MSGIQKRRSRTLLRWSSGRLGLVPNRWVVKSGQATRTKKVPEEHTGRCVLSGEQRDKALSLPQNRIERLSWQAGWILRTHLQLTLACLGEQVRCRARCEVCQAEASEPMTTRIYYSGTVPGAKGKVSGVGCLAQLPNLTSQNDFGQVSLNMRLYSIIAPTSINVIGSSSVQCASTYSSYAAPLRIYSTSGKASICVRHSAADQVSSILWTILFDCSTCF